MPPNRHVIAGLATAAALAFPSAALAGQSSGGSGLTGGQTTASSGSTSASSSPGALAPGGNPMVTAANTPVSASGSGISFTSTASGLQNRRLTFSGSVPSGDAGMVAEIERARIGSQRWVPTTHTTVSPGGGFTVGWPATRSGRFQFEVVLATPTAHAADAGSGGAAANLASPAAVSPPVAITVFATSIATLYGPGFWGGRTACGQTLRRSTLGVASRTLRCGTPVTLDWGGHLLTVPVIDRGPYANGANWDLTMATARALGIDGTETIGAEPQS